MPHTTCSPADIAPIHIYIRCSIIIHTFFLLVTSLTYADGPLDVYFFTIFPVVSSPYSNLARISPRFRSERMYLIAVPWTSYDTYTQINLRRGFLNRYHYQRSSAESTPQTCATVSTLRHIYSFRASPKRVNVLNVDTVDCAHTFCGRTWFSASHLSFSNTFLSHSTSCKRFNFPSYDHPSDAPFQNSWLDSHPTSRY